MGLALLLAPLSDAMRPQVILEDEIDLSQSPAVFSERPEVVVTNDGTVHVVWEEGINIKHRYRWKGTEEWSPTLTIFRKGYDPALATDGRTVAVAFVQGKRDATETTEILFKIWDSDTRSWPLLAAEIQTGDENIAADGQQPDLALSNDGSALWLIWVDTTWGERQPYFARIRLADRTVAASAIDPLADAQGPAIAIGPENTVHVVWTQQFDTRKSYIKHAYRTDVSPWTLDSTAYFREAKQARAPDVGATAGNLCMVWHENTSKLVQGAPESDNEVVLYCRGDGEYHNISNTADHSLMPRLAMDDLRGQMVLWKENRIPREIVFRQGPPPPANGEAMVDEGPVDMPSVAFHELRGEGYVHSVWSEETDDGGSDVRYARWQVGVPTPTPSATAIPTVTATFTPSPSPTVGPTGTATPRWYEIFVPHNSQNQ